MRHLCVSSLVLEQLACELYDIGLLNARKLDCAGFDCFRTLGLAAQYQNRLAETGCLLLKSAGVGHDHEAARHQIVHLVNGQRMNQMNAVIAAEELLCGLTHIRTEVNRINEVHIRICFAQLSNRTADVLHRFAVVFAAVSRDKDNTIVLEVELFQLLITE